MKHGHWALGTVKWATPCQSWRLFYRGRGLHIAALLRGNWKLVQFPWFSACFPAYFFNNTCIFLQSNSETFLESLTTRFSTSGFFMNQFPAYLIWAVSKFFRKFSEIFAAPGEPTVSLTPAEMEKIFYKKSFKYFFGHVWVVELTYRQVHFKVWAVLLATGVVSPQTVDFLYYWCSLVP